MDMDLRPGKYIVAVSGGVDSVVLLHMLTKQPSLRLTVAHYDHGIRGDSVEDRRFVQELAGAYGLPFVYHAGKLGASVSEAAARQARYNFLRRVRRITDAKAIITAHHQDDVLETIILNLLRGTGRRGLSSLGSTGEIQRPLLGMSKKEVLRYADREGLRWREDSTNADERYLRNYIRRRIMPRFAEPDREELLRIASNAAELNLAIGEQLINYLHLQPAPNVLDRRSFVMLPHAVAREVMAEWLLQNTQVELSRKVLERLTVAAKVGRNGTKLDAEKRYWLVISRKELALELHER